MFLSNIFFFFELLWIFSSSYIYYLYNNDYSLFIKLLAKRLSKKNILYVKFFQAISLNNNIIDSEINNELIKYTDYCPYENSDVDWNVLHELKQKFNYELVYGSPINSGMISLVYKTIDLTNKKTVIIKIKRCNIDEKLDNAIEKMKFIINIISYIPSLNTFNIFESFNKNIVYLKKQLNFEEEVQNTLRMKNEYSNLKYIKIPDVYSDVTKTFPNIIAMEYIDGKHISKLDELDYENYARLLVKYGFVSSFMVGFAHGDLHPGNILFIKNENNNLPKYQIGLIDFGIVLDINPKIRDVFLSAFAELYTTPTIELSKQFFYCFIEPKEIFETLPIEHKNNLIEMGSELIDDAFKTKEINITKLFDFILNFNNYVKNHDLNSYGLYINDDFIKMQMGIAMAQGVSICLCKEKFMDIGNSVLNEMLHTDLFT